MAGRYRTNTAAKSKYLESHIATQVVEKFQRLYVSNDCLMASKSKFWDVPLYRKYKFGGCQTGTGSASGSEIGRKDITNVYIHTAEDGLSSGINLQVLSLSDTALYRK